MILEQTPWPQIRKAAPDRVVVLPIAATEQHGPHLGVGTDTTLVSEVARLAEAARPQSMILCPTLPLGMSHHHLSYAGTISISPETYTRVLVDAVESIAQWPATRILLLNGHGGNMAPGRQALAILMAKGRSDLQVTFANYWELAGKAWQGDPPMIAPSISHAGEYETSAMMQVRPEAVHIEKTYPRKRTWRNPYIGWEDDQPNRGVTMMAATEYITDNGVMGGDPETATKEKGKHLIHHAVAGLVEFLDSFATWKPLEDERNGED